MSAAPPAPAIRRAPRTPRTSTRTRATTSTRATTHELKRGAAVALRDARARSRIVACCDVRASCYIKTIVGFASPRVASAADGAYLSRVRMPPP